MITPENARALREMGVDPDNFSLDHYKALLAIAMGQASSLEKKLRLARGFLQMVTAINPDFVQGLFAIQIAERNEDRPLSEDCVGYALGQDVDPEEFYDNMFKTFIRSSDPVPGAFAVYFNQEMTPLHIGKVTQRGTVVSRWGSTGHVYEHSPLLAPIGYGDFVIYYLSPENKYALQN